MKKLPITLIVLTKDEEANLGECLKSSAGHVSQMIIVDSGSTDRTLDIARQYGAEVRKHSFRNQAEQFNWALDSTGVQEEWVLRLDADEAVSEELWQEIEDVFDRGIPADVSGFYMKRRVYFLGRWIRHGGYYPTWLLRLFREGKARSEERPMDEHIVVLEGRVLNLQNDFKDENRKSLRWWLEKHRGYASREARAMLSERCSELKADLRGSQPERKRWFKKNVYLRIPIFVRPFLYFFYRYFLRAGFLDGLQGLVFHFLQGFWYRFLVDARYASLLLSGRNKK